MGKKRRFNIKSVLGGRAGGRVSEPDADLLGFSHATTAKVFRDWPQNEKISSEKSLRGKKCVVDVKGQRSGRQTGWRS